MLIRIDHLPLFQPPVYRLTDASFRLLSLSAIRGQGLFTICCSGCSKPLLQVAAIRSAKSGLVSHLYQPTSSSLGRCSNLLIESRRRSPTKAERSTSSKARSHPILPKISSAYIVFDRVFCHRGYTFIHSLSESAKFPSNKI